MEKSSSRFRSRVLCRFEYKEVSVGLIYEVRDL